VNRQVSDMTLEELRQRKRLLGYTNKQIAQLSGVPAGTVQKVLGGITASPRYETMKSLEKVLAPDGRSEDMNYPQDSRHYPSVLKEDKNVYMAERPKDPYVWDRQGSYTLEDYYALPDEKRVELIDGVFYDMASPSGVHQELIGLLYLVFAGHVRRKKGSFKVFLSPFDVQLDRDNKTMVEPDLMIICKREIIRMRCCYGAPDLAIEILSPSSRRKDMILKTHKYEHAGVREYWIIDPDKRQVIVYDFEHEKYPMLFGFEDRVPVGIWEGDLEVDFAEISAEIAYLYEQDEDHDGEQD